MHDPDQGDEDQSTETAKPRRVSPRGCLIAVLAVVLLSGAAIALYAVNAPDYGKLGEALGTGIATAAGTPARLRARR